MGFDIIAAVIQEHTRSANGDDEHVKNPVKGKLEPVGFFDDEPQQVSSQNARYQQYGQAYQVFFLAALLFKPVAKYNKIKVQQYQAPNAPAGYLAKPISDIYLTHSVKLPLNIVIFQAVLY